MSPGTRSISYPKRATFKRLHRLEHNQDRCPAWRILLQVRLPGASSGQEGQVAARRVLSTHTHLASNGRSLVHVMGISRQKHAVLQMFASELRLREEAWFLINTAV